MDVLKPSAAFAQEAPLAAPPADAPTPPALRDPTQAPEVKKQWCNGSRSCGGEKAKANVVATVAATVITTVAVAIALGVANANAQPANTLLVRQGVSPNGGRSEAAETEASVAREERAAEAHLEVRRAAQRRACRAQREDRPPQ